MFRAPLDGFDRDARGQGRRSDESAMMRSQRMADCDFWLKSALEA